MTRSLLGALVALFTLAAPALSLDVVQSTTTAARLPSTLCMLTPGGIAINRADGTLSFCSPTSAIKTRVLIDPAQSLASQLSNLDASGLRATLTSTDVSDTLVNLIVSRAPLANPAFTGSASAPVMMVGRQSAANGVTGGLCIGGAAADEGGACSMLASDGIANWTRLQPSKNYNAQEFNIYGTAAQGAATATAGTNTLKRITSAGGDPGSPFDTGWVGRLFYWARTVYRVASVTDANTMTVTTPAGAAVSFGATATDRYHYVRTTAAGVVNVSGTAVTRVSGDPFIPFINGTDFILRINGTAYGVASYTDKDHITLSTSAGPQTGVAFDYSLNINNQIAAIRAQKTTGIDEENVTLEALATGSYRLRVGKAGAGQYYPFYVQNGDVSGVPTILADFSPGSASFGGRLGSEALRVPAASGYVNRMDVIGGVAGSPVSLQSRGADANVGANIDMQGSGGLTVTSGGRAQTVFQVFGTTSTNQNWLAAYAFNVPAIQAQGPASDISVALIAKGYGSVQSFSNNAVAFSAFAFPNAVNSVTTTANVEGAAPSVQAIGSDTNISLPLLGKGASGALTGAFVRTADPTTADVPAGQCADWQNTTAGTYKHVCNFGGTLRSVVMQ